ncbi:MAG TPA: DUF1592 domain-containing protein [Opitutaceae bacterium]|nr:DUF1592 domain-containing protein [Opitutaceae bacterium]
MPSVTVAIPPASRAWLAALPALGLLFALSPTPARAAAPAAVEGFHRTVEPLLKKYCYDCHGDGMDKGGVAFDGFTTEEKLISKHSLWLAALKNTRAGLMPPHEEGLARPTDAELKQLADWIKYQAFGIDPANPDPGRITVRRLNRVEYRNTVRDLVGIDFNSEVEFPPDDSGNGFDNNGDVLTLSPLLLEKYLAAAEAIVDKALPKVSRVMRERTATGRDFRAENGRGNGEQLSAKVATTVSKTFKIDQAEKYQLVAELEVRGSFDFDPAHCKLTCRVDGDTRFVEDIVWSERRTLRHEYDIELTAGDHVVSFEVEPLPAVEVAPKAQEPIPATSPESNRRQAGGPRPVTSVNVRVASVQVRGPLNPEHWVAPENHARFYPQGAAPAEPAARDRYASDILRRFATRAFRRPVSDAKVEQLLTIARKVYTQPGNTFEEGIARAFMAVLASPRFLFRVEEPQPGSEKQPFALVDEHALASRLSYFFWSTMPDEELFRLAEKSQLRSNLRGQVDRMLKDSRAQAFIRNFTGQWLQARDVEFVPINARIVMGPNAPRNKDGRIEFDSAFRKLMRSETETYFEHVIREDRSILELVDSDYTFLNERLATHYGIPDVTGDQLRLVKLPADSVRGGVLTQGTVLSVTSNPTRTSPVKRGLFVLENVLGTPPPPPPPNVPDLEDSKKEFKDREPKLSEILAVHRANKLCSSCHERMDPLGLAMENFNALGAWRDTEARQPIDPAGHLITGEKFANVRELKKILANERHLDVYRCITEKLLTYALGRGLEPYDTHTVDEIVAALERGGGKMSLLVMGVVESAPFQKQRTLAATAGIAVNSP